MLANEIQTIKKVNDVIQAYKKSNKLSESYLKSCNESVPEVIYYGVLILQNFDQQDEASEEQKVENFDSYKLCGYYIMP